MQALPITKEMRVDPVFAIRYLRPAKNQTFLSDNN